MVNAPVAGTLELDLLELVVAILLDVFELLLVETTEATELFELLVVVALVEVFELLVATLPTELLIELRLLLDVPPFGRVKKFATKLKLVFWLTKFPSSTLPI